MFDLGQIADDILVKCNQISKTIHDEAMDDIKASMLEPDSPESRSIINRAITEAFGEVKVLCQRYLKSGRTTDNNNLERIIKNITYVVVQETDSQGHKLYTCTVDGVETVVYQGAHYWMDLNGYVVNPDGIPEPKMITTDEIDTIEYEKVVLLLSIPNFNVSVTDHLKSAIHKYAVDYSMARFLQDQLTEKSSEYKALADGEDRSLIIRDLNARDRFNCRKPSWT